jgi:hypothetical protein
MMRINEGRAFLDFNGRVFLNSQRTVKMKRGFGRIPAGIGEGCSVMNETIFSKPN